MIVGMNLLVRPAVLTDKRQISNLIQFSPQVHRHLDWRNVLEWLGSAPFFVLESEGQVIAALGCPPDPTSVAWLRLFVNSGKIPLQESWQMLWVMAHAELIQMGIFATAAIVLKDWLRDLLLSSGFTSRQSIIMLERDSTSPVERALPPEISLRVMMPYDLPAVADVDSSAFELLWQNALPVLEKAYPQAEWATVVEIDKRVIGYQISTRNLLGVHLARLAVRPSFKGKGLGYALVADLIMRAGKRGISHITVNTQSDNEPSLALYQRMGFHETGECYPVLQMYLS